MISSVNHSNPPEDFRSVTLARERREKSRIRGKIYLARGSIDCPQGNLQSLGHIYPYHTLPRNSILSRIDSLAR